MAQDATIGELLDALDIAPTIGGRAAGARARAGEAPGRAGAEFGLHIVADLKRLLRTDPSLMMSTAPALLGQRPTVAQAAALLDDGEMALNRADVTLRQVRANREGASFELPPEHQFEGYDTTEIPIQPGLTRFEDLVDAPAWALTAIEAWAFRLTHRKPDFIAHTSSPTEFVYPLHTTNGDAVIALFSDWGTGYYHSQYIAKHIGRLKPGQAIHLGDVYYTGRQADFDERFVPILERYITKEIPLYTLNANHEMDSHGLAYFAYLGARREAGPAGEPLHPQEGSYFCLTSDHYQVIGIDTAFDRNGRLRGGDQKNWVQARLAHGKSAGKINILLSQNEPYERDAKPLLTEDLLTLVANRMIDLWFWGDQHYCALYPPTTSTPFGGSCIGHGGYPYRLKDEEEFGAHFVRPLFAELETRFPADLNLRTGLGNNGFCMLRLGRDRLAITYLDWRNRERFRIELPVEGGQLRWPAGHATPVSGRRLALA